MTWSPAQYTLFEAERNQPIHDLLARIPVHHVKNAIDIGCGPGNSTELLRRHLLPTASLAAFDSSPEMIQAARSRLPDLHFDVADISTWKPVRKLDLIFSNAVLQWLPSHESLLPRLLGYANEGGTFAAQIPDNLEEPTHLLMPEVAAQLGWSKKLGGALSSREPRHSPDWYFEVLSTAASSVQVWKITYFHFIPSGVPGIVEWFKGTGLRPILNVLDPQEQQIFLREYEEGLSHHYRALPSGGVLLPFPRLFFTATI